MGDFVMRTSDQIQITTAPALVPQLMMPIPLIGTGTTIMAGKMPICLQGDELPIAIAGPIAYTQPPYVVPGMGTLKILLQPDNLSKKTVNKKAILLKGKSFNALFEVKTPAQTPAPASTPDPQVAKTWKCQFITANANVQIG